MTIYYQEFDDIEGVCVFQYGEDLNCNGGSCCVDCI